MTINPAYSMLGTGQNRPNNRTSDPDHQVTSPQTSTDQLSSNQAPPPTEQRASSTAKLDNVKESPVKPKGDKKQNVFDWEGSWAVEIGSIALGIIGFALLIGFLAKIHNTAYTSWQYTASPNTVVSIIVTITKAALLVSVSSCLSQLKWNQYGNSASAPLYHMQVIDQASRGPWGSVNVLWSGLKERRMNALIISGALITIITLAIDPFAQQILTFPLRTTLDFDEPAWIRSTNQYYAANGYDDGYVIYSEENNWLPPTTLTAILSGLAQANSPPEPQCGSGNCTYPSFVTLGICCHCEDITSKADQKCNVQGVPHSAENTSDNHVNCTYTTPSGFSVDLNPSDLSMMQYDEGRMFYSVEFWLSRLIPNGSIFGIESPIISFLASNQSETLMYAPHNRTDPPPRPSMTECAIYYCEKEYAPSNYSSVTQSDEPIPVIRTQQLIPHHNWESDSDNLTFYNGSLYPPHGSTTISSNSSYIVDQDISGPLEHVLSNIFNATFQPNNDGSRPGALSLTSLLRNGNISELLDSMSTSITDRFRASSRGNRVHGQAHKVENFIDVRWPWIILPGCVILGSILLLLGTALVSKRQHAVLWKSSVLPLMMSCLDTTPEHDISSLQNVDEVQRVSKKIDITMDQSGGPLIFTEN